MFKQLLGESFAVIEKMAPVLASALGAPEASVPAMFALNLLSNALGVPINNLPQAIMTHVDAQDKLANLEAQFCNWFKGISTFKPPARVEFNVKLEWDNNST